VHAECQGCTQSLQRTLWPSRTKNKYTPWQEGSECEGPHEQHSQQLHKVEHAAPGPADCQHAAARHAQQHAGLGIVACTKGATSLWLLLQAQEKGEAPSLQAILTPQPLLRPHELAQRGYCWHAVDVCQLQVDLEGVPKLRDDARDAQGV